MAETRRVSSAPSHPRRAARPRLPHPPRVQPPRLRVDETQDLRQGWREEVEPPSPREPEPEPTPAAAGPPRFAAPRPPRRARAEPAVLAVLLLGLALNALVLLRHAALSRADVLLGTTVLLAGLALLVLMEIYRRTER
jgi:hypothetical protein